MCHCSVLEKARSLAQCTGHSTVSGDKFSTWDSPWCNPVIIRLNSVAQEQSRLPSAAGEFPPNFPFISVNQTSTYCKHKAMRQVQDPQTSQKAQSLTRCDSLWFTVIHCDSVSHSLLQFQAGWRDSPLNRIQEQKKNIKEAKWQHFGKLTCSLSSGR